ncbi:MAG TPA: GDP-mannose 4,6-dehydratase [Candidatus Saccharimonadia bacterium]|nr:GDP-mannose 4,6-dehydratase [Candidatus Saccharimonadia bacterium]
MTKKRVLITGVGGSIGCHVLRHLMVNTDWDVVGLDSFRHKGISDRVYRVTKKHPQSLSRLKIFTHDLRAPISDMLARQMGQFEYIINLASISDVDFSIEAPGDVLRDNGAIAVTMLDYARTVKPEVFLQVSTDEVYGQDVDGRGHPEWDSIIPSNPYSASKAAQECAAIAYWRSYGVPLILVNFMNAFGEMQSPSKFPAIVQRKVRNDEIVSIHQFGSGDYGSRFYIHARNAADAMLFIIRRRMPFQHVHGAADRPDRYNVVGERRIGNLELAQMIAAMIGKPLKWEPVDCRDDRPGHDRSYGLDGSKLAALGWSAPIDFETSLRNTVAWYTRNSEWLDAR